MLGVLWEVNLELSAFGFCLLQTQYIGVVLFNKFLQQAFA